MMKVVVDRSEGRLHYYQDFHDVASIFLLKARSPPVARQPPRPIRLVCKALVTPAVRGGRGHTGAGAVPHHHLRFVMTEDMVETRRLLGLLRLLIARLAPEAAAIIAVRAHGSSFMCARPPLCGRARPSAWVGQAVDILEPIFALSWLLTWFVHDLHDGAEVSAPCRARTQTHARGGGRGSGKDAA
jgi:hypothetical protein